MTAILLILLFAPIGVCVIAGLVLERHADEDADRLSRDLPSPY